MGSSTATAECRSALRQGSGNSGAPNRICMDERRPDLGGLHTPDHWLAPGLSAVAGARQHALLSKLIGGGKTYSSAIATRLLSAFGTMGGVLSATPEALLGFVNDDCLVDRLVAAKPAVLECLGERIIRIPFDLNDVTVQQWIVGLFSGYRRERIHVALLDKAKRLIFSETVTEGGLGKIEGNLRLIVRSGFEIDASGVVLMHNHPSGLVRPSKADIEETRRIGYILNNLDMPLEDHLIIAENKIFSMRKAMLL